MITTRRTLIAWNDPLNQDNLTTPSKKLLEIFDDHDLNQFVKEPTRRQGNTHNISGLVLSNNKDIISGVKVIYGISDHDIVLFTVKTSCQRKRNVRRKVYIKKKADSDRIKQVELQTFVSTQELNSGGVSVDKMWDDFEGNIRRIMETCIRSKLIV